MKYCTSCNQQENILSKVDEVRFHINSLNLALSYSESHPNKRIIIEIATLHNAKNPTIDKLHKLQQENANLFYDFYDLKDLREYSQLIKQRFMYHYPVTTWGMVQILKFYGVSDITIGEPLVFDLNNVNKYIKNRGIIVRVCPHQVKTDAFSLDNDNDHGINHFFVVPQHANWYNAYIDVFDIIDDNVIREETLVNLYVSKEEYKLNLDYLILNIGCQLPPNFIDEAWLSRRSICQQKCLKDARECWYCKRVVDLCESLSKIEK